MNGFVISGIRVFDRSGHSVSSAGDVNNDGIDDLIIGAPFADPNNQNIAGESYVVFGGADVGSGGVVSLSDLDGSNGFVIRGIDSDDESGESVSSAGDINNDGTDDLIIGAPGADPNGQASGECYVVFGGTGVGSGGVLYLSELDGSNGFVIPGIRSFDFLGRSVSSAGDVNDDGIDDLIIGAPEDLNGGGAGGSYVIFGGSGVGSGGVLNLSLLDGSNGFVIRGIDSRDSSGESVSSVGDVNNDGIDDLIIGAPDANPNGSGSGESYVIFGGSALGSSGVLNLSDLDGTNGVIINGIDDLDELGRSVSSAGDVNNDGIDDLIIGAPGADPAGESYVVFGRSADCNSDGILDDCDLANCPAGDPSCADCNQNSIPDECDLRNYSGDCNGTGIPDECEVPQADLPSPVVSTWIAEFPGLWNDPSSWCLPEVPDNNVAARFDVSIEGPGALVTLNISPTIETLTISNGAILEVNEDSGATTRSIVVSGAASMIRNNGGRIRARDGIRFILDSADIDQSGGAGDGELCAEGALSRIEITGRAVIGGRALAIAGGQIELKGGGELRNVLVEGDVVVDNVLVPVGQTGVLSGMIINEGVIGVGAKDASIATFLVPTETGTALTGPGCVDMKNRFSRLGEFKGSFTNMSGHRIEGAGRIFGTFSNLGGASVIANHPCDALILAAPGTKINDGFLVATNGGTLNGGTLKIETDVQGLGSLTANNEGRIEAGVTTNIILGADLLVDTGGSYGPVPGLFSTASIQVQNVTINENPNGGLSSSVKLTDAMSMTVLGNLILDGTGAIPCPSAGSVAGCIPPIKGIRKSAEISVSGSFSLIGSVQFTHSSDVPMLLGGDLDNRSPSAGCFDWTTGGLIMNGTVAQRFEVAGVDMGPTTNGFNSNFAIGTLEIAAGSSVSFVNENANTSGVGVCTEALYVDSLTLRAGAQIALLDTRIYYRTLVDDGGVVVPSGCGGLVGLSPIVQTNPPACSIDSRQPSRPDDPTPQGWTLVTFQFENSRFAIPITAERFIAFEVSEPPSIIQPAFTVIPNAPEIGWATVEFDTPIKPGRWTCLQYTVDGSEYCFGSLPGDVDSNRTVHSSDIDSVINCVSGAASCEVWQCDADRSGSCKPTDLLRVIDILNGADVYEPWRGVSLAPVSVCAPLR